MEVTEPLIRHFARARVAQMDYWENSALINLKEQWTFDKAPWHVFIIMADRVDFNTNRETFYLAVQYDVDEEQWSYVADADCEALKVGCQWAEEWRKKKKVNFT